MKIARKFKAKATHLNFEYLEIQVHDLNLQQLPVLSQAAVFRKTIDFIINGNTIPNVHIEYRVYSKINNRKSTRVQNIL